LKIADFKQIVKDSRPYGSPPCSEGWKWLLKETRGCKDTDEFFDKCKEIEAQLWRPYFAEKPENKVQIMTSITPHGYLNYIFKYCLDWGKMNPMGFCSEHGSSTSYLKFIKKNFNVVSTAQIPIPELCDALKRAFSDV
jgi:hypothetical protein